VRRVLDYIREEVMNATGKRQQPFTSGSLPGSTDYYFVAGHSTFGHPGGSARNRTLDATIDCTEIGTWAAQRLCQKSCAK
jgi:hypothetical protein